MATTGRIRTIDVDKIFEGKVESKPILCTDGHRSYQAFAKSNQLEHQTVKVSAKEYVKKRIYHIQHVNQTASELNKWIRKFNGVSTKYPPKLLELVCYKQTNSRKSKSFEENCFANCWCFYCL